MGKKENFGRAMYDMFGVGKDTALDQLEEMEAGEEENDELLPTPAERPESEKVEDYRVEKMIPVHTYEGTYLAAGTMMQGTLTAKGDVEIAGQFEGEIVAKGKVTIHSNITSRITAAGLALVGCNLTGDVEIAGGVSLDEQSTINGNVRAESMICSGRVKGDLDIQDNLVLDESAQVDGNIKVDTMSMARGAKISGSIEMRNSRQ